jgi:archaellum component FlaF (FlaF/FlaG flagellin family)
MKRFVRDERGNASLWAVFIAVILCMLSAVVYTGATLYSTYQAAQTELERAANVSVDSSLINKNVRDLLLDIPEMDSSQALDDNLIQAGYVQESGDNWIRTVNGKTFYSLKDMQVSVAGEVLYITATISMPLSWGVGNITSVDLPIHVESRVLYIN